MENHKTDKSEQLLADLKRVLAPLGVGLIWTEDIWWLCSKQDSSKIASMESVDGVSILGYKKLETLQSELCSEISRILVDDHSIPNPYLGCRSLEEMQIRCDLM